MIFKSQVLTQASGSVGGVTYSHNRGGMYQRARSIPVNPNTAEQQAVRGLMASLTSHWGNTLTDAQRDDWNTYGRNVPMLNALGDQIELSGLSHYIRSNLPRIQAAAARIDDAPTVFNLGEFTNPTATADESDNAVKVAFTNTDEWANESGGYAFVRIGRPVAPTINFYAGPWRYSGKIVGATPTPPTSPATITTPWGVSEGQRIYAEVRFQRADGRLTLPFRLDAIAVA